MAGTAVAQKKYDQGASDTEIKLGQTMPYSGPASAYGTVGRIEQLYFKMVNDRGGINGRKVELLSYDDAYSPPKTVEQTRKLVENDGVLLMFQGLGTPPQSAVQKYLNEKKIPQLLVSSGATRFSDHKKFPWTMAFNPNYQSEAHIYAQLILKSYPNAKIGILFQNDDFGRDYVTGLKDALGAKAKTMIVAEESYEVSDPTVDSQIVKLKSSGADLLFNVATPKFAAQAIKKIAQMEWKPVHLLNINSTGVGEVMLAAGGEHSKGIISVNYGKDPRDHQWDNDPGMKKFKEFMQKYAPGEDMNSTFNSYGYSVAQFMEEILKRCGDDLTRANVMKQATSFKDFVGDLSLPGMSISTAPDDYRFNKQFKLMKFTGTSWELFGDVLTDTFKAH
ncbi:MAG: ABC transporter substrate-binding protein [Burkholderiaceae bacterium]